jgi:hypothetical protein
VGEGGKVRQPQAGVIFAEEFRCQALGQKRTLKRFHPMSGLPPKADIDHHGRDVRFVPEADIGVSFDDFVGTSR